MMLWAHEKKKQNIIELLQGNIKDISRKWNLVQNDNLHRRVTENMLSNGNECDRIHKVDTT